MKSPFLSVVIPTYNRSPLAERAIRSVLDQSCNPLEVVVVNDGSTDDTSEVLAQLPGIRLITKPNGGLSSARNAGIEAASSDWIGLLDDDDTYEPGMIEAMGDYIDTHPAADVIYTATYRVDQQGNRICRSHSGHRQPSNPLASLAMENFVLSSAVCVRKTVFMNAGMFDEAVKLCEDQDMWLRVAALGAQFGYIDQPLANITRHAGSMSGSGERMAKATIDVLQKRAEYLQSLRRADGGEWWLANAHYRLGRVYWEASNWKDALFEFNTAAAYDPGHRRARLYAWASSHPAAAGAFIRARNVKRSVVAVMQRLKLVEARWGA